MAKAEARASNTRMAYDQRTAERVRQVLAGRQDVVEKKMMGGLCFMVSGKMCCSVGGKGGLLVRVGAQGYQTALVEAHVQPMKMGKRVMSGFVRIAPEGYRTAAQLRRWVLRGVQCAEEFAALDSFRGNRPRSRPIPVRGESGS